MATQKETIIEMTEEAKAARNVIAQLKVQILEYKHEAEAQREEANRLDEICCEKSAKIAELMAKKTSGANKEVVGYLTSAINGLMESVDE